MIQELKGLWGVDECSVLVIHAPADAKTRRIGMGTQPGSGVLQLTHPDTGLLGVNTASSGTVTFITEIRYVAHYTLCFWSNPFGLYTA